MWTGAVEEVYQDFLKQLHLLTDCQYDASEPTDQSFPLQACSFQDHVLDLEARLVSIIRGTLEDCCVSSSAVKILNMFGPVLERPLIQEQLRPQLVRLVDMVMTELDQVEALVQRKSLTTEVLSKFRASPSATLRWTQQLLLRAHSVFLSFQTVQYL
ncbi:dynein axonemal heavy chain 17-like [Dunckerocampus dactyliophorus]|uniref:dynein axonemal heavy chain 17-like n=1 Tax=Dunckerocampus dactyliophorus TaxID=161453 RepID=UPI0024066C7D|nr:dynein axonemal heavy chain 17-like [Dunckerocampus dactyliophorus]